VPNQAGGLRFDVYERVHLPEDVAAIDELEEIELVPRIQIVEQGEQVSLKGHLLLTGVYRAEGGLGEVQSLEHFIPVEISLPLNRVNRLDDLSVEIDNFDVDLLSARTINITGVLSLYGIEVEQPQEEKNSWEEPFTAVHRRDGNTDSEFQQFETFSQGQHQEPYRETFQTQPEQGWQEGSEAEDEEELSPAFASSVEHQPEIEQAETIDSSWSGPSDVFQAALNREAAQRREIAERQQEAALREAAEVERLQRELVEQREQELAEQEAQEAAQREFAARQREIAQREAAQREAALRDAIAQREQRAAQRERELAAQEAARRDSIIAAQREHELRERERELAAQEAQELAQQEQLVREHSHPLGIDEDQESLAALDHDAGAQGLSAEADFITAQADVDADEGFSSDQEQVLTSGANQQLFAEQERIDQELERKEMRVALGSKPSSDETKQGASGLGFRSLLQSSLREQEARAVAEQTAEKKAEEVETHSGDEIEWKTLFLNRPSEEKGFRKLRMCIVQREETLELIAGRYQLQAREIALYNRLADQSISEGQVLYIPK